MKKLRLKRVCDVSIAEMTPVTGGHYCPHCDKKVYDLRRATYAEAKAIGRESDATPCVRILPGQDGFAILRRSRTAAVGAALFAATAAGGCGEDGSDHGAHPGTPHSDYHDDEFATAGEPMEEFFEEDDSTEAGGADETDEGGADSTDVHDPLAGEEHTAEETAGATND